MSWESEFFNYLKQNTKFDLDKHQDNFRDFKYKQQQKCWDYYKEPNTFEVTKDHIKLLKNSYTSWWECETGAPSMDCKRPYGSSDVVGSMGEVLGIKPKGKGEYEGEFTEKQEHNLLKLHRTMETALQLVLRFGSFKPGKYRRKNGWSDWEKIK